MSHADQRRPIVRWCVGLCSALLLTGCATIRPQEAGYIIGAIAGGAFGSAPGAALGALVGTATGALIAKPFEKLRKRKERASLQERLDEVADGSTPKAFDTAGTPQPTERIWIDEHVIDGRVIPGHFSSRVTPTPDYGNESTYYTY